MKTPADPAPITDSRLAALCSEQVQQAFLRYREQFSEITLRARQRFLERDWPGSYGDAALRLRLYNQVVDGLADSVEALLGSRLADRLIWMAAKAVYSSFIAQDPAWEVAESFFNSLTRRIFHTEGVDQNIEFVHTDYDAPPLAPPGDLVRRRSGACLVQLLTEAVTDVAAGGFEPDRWESLEPNLTAAAERIQASLPQPQGELVLDMISQVFFRGRGAYLVGHVYQEGASLPLALCLRHESEKGIRVDAVLVDEHDLSILFSYTRSYFRVVNSCPYELVRELHSLLPRKPLGELYTAIGYHRHGKTELYRDFMAHFVGSSDRFVAADGTRGMVMSVFTLPSYDLVFKLIKDRFDYPKEASSEDVKRRYKIVFEHDRAGRLVEAHLFEHLRIPRARFSDDLLQTLLREASHIVREEDEDVVIAHVYIERRVRPLNLFFNEAEDPRVVAAALDYGQALKDLAAMNIFAGDLLTKNFGVTRNGRVVFYDYDELCFLTDCNFRDLPEPQTPEQEMASEPWFTVRENDIFPEEFPRFLVIPEPARKPFYEAHGDLFRPAFWRGVQERLRAGEVLEARPYKAACRLEI